MSYHIYTTDGIILKRTTFGEANVFLHILTEDLGVITASAQAVRLSSSKLRPALQEYTLSSISCVKGKNSWKITNALEKENFFFDHSKSSHKILSQITSVILKMIPGESPHPEIFRTVMGGFEFLKSLSEKEISDFEALLVLRILHQLGYVGHGKEINLFLEDNQKWSGDLLKKISENKSEIISTINKALRESQL